MLTAAIVLASRMTIVAAIVVSVSVVAGRSGPVLGAMLASLPVSAGPAYVFLAIDHGPEFIRDSTIASILAVSANASFVVAHNLVSRVAGTLPSLMAGLVAFCCTIMLLNLHSWSLLSASLAGTALLFAGILATRTTRRDARPFATPSRPVDLAIRAASVMGVVAAVTILGELAGPRAAGYGALLPVVFMSFVLVMQPRVGGAAVAGLFSHALFGLLGYAAAFSVINLTAVPLGPWLALTLGLATSLAWNCVILLLRTLGLLRL